MSISSETALRVLQCELEIRIRPPREQVREAITEETDVWWLPDFHVVGLDSVVTLDTCASGHLIEALPDGGSLTWYTGQMSVSGKSLHLVGHLAPGWGGPSTTRLELSLEEGWKTLPGEGLRAHAEG